MSISDNLITRYFQILILLSLAELSQIELELSFGVNLHDVKRDLGKRIVTKLHS